MMKSELYIKRDQKARTHIRIIYNTMEIRKRSEDEICCRYSGFLCRSLSMYIKANIMAQGDIHASLEHRIKDITKHLMCVYLCVYENCHQIKIQNQKENDGKAIVPGHMCSIFLVEFSYRTRGRFLKQFHSNI